MSQIRSTYLRYTSSASETACEDRQVAVPKRADLFPEAAVESTAKRWQKLAQFPEDELQERTRHLSSLHFGDRTTWNPPTWNLELRFAASSTIEPLEPLNDLLPSGKP